jgi:DNA-binding transcriptional MocR family regulator
MITILGETIRRQPGPKYLGICNAIAQLINHGHLKPGDKLPPQRDLADALGVTLGTVTRGYQQAEKRGLLMGETGRGTFVRSSESDRFSLHALHNRLDRQQGAQIDLDLNFPMDEGAPDLNAALAALSKSGGLSALMRYQPAAGLRHHRRAGLEWVSRFGVSTDEQNVVITAGGQHAIHTALLAQNDAEGFLAVESFTYPGLLNTARLVGRRLIAVPMDSQAMVPEALTAACRQHKVAGLYLMPTIHNPTNAQMSLERRRQIAEIARQRDLFIIEDEVYAPLKQHYQTPVQAMAPERTYFLTSLSKIVAPGLRVGYLVVPPARRRYVEAAMAASVWMTPPLMGEIAARWIDDGTARQAMQVKREAAIRRMDGVTKALGHQRLFVQSGSLHAWLCLPDSWKAQIFASESAARGVSVVPSGSFCPNPQPPVEAVRICFGAPPTDADVAAGVSILAQLVSEAHLPSAALI